MSKGQRRKLLLTENHRLSRLPVSRGQRQQMEENVRSCNNAERDFGCGFPPRNEGALTTRVKDCLGIQFASISLDSQHDAVLVLGLEYCI